MWLVCGALVLVAMLSKEVWIGLGVIGVIALVAYLAIKHLGQKTNGSNASSSRNARRHEPTLAELMAANPSLQIAPRRVRLAPAQPKGVPSPQTVRQAPSQPAHSHAASSRPTETASSRTGLPVEADTFYSSSAAPQIPAASHAIPKAPDGFGDGRWVPPGESIEVAGVNLPGGMLYVGGRLKALNGGAEPCLISGRHTVARVGNYRARQMGYWPSYAEASPEERRAYLNWLSEGRSNPDCDIGYVFLFFYGLERRVIVDSRDDPAARNDWPAIIVELRRLLAIYGEKSGSFNRYAGELLRWIELDGKSNQLYKQPVPDFPRTYELPPYLRLALGQTAVDRAPLPAHLALAWLRLSPEYCLRTAATRCPNEFERLFAQRYHEDLGPGLVLPKNRTKLKLVYQAASAGLRGANITMAFGDVPDVTALTAPIRKLMEIANQCTDELGSYSRLVGKDPGAAAALDGLLLLPATLWPAATQARLRALTAQMRDGRLSLPLKELLAALGGADQAVNSDRARGLARALEGAEIGMEPHVLGGAKAPGEQDTVVLFAQPLMDSDVGSRAEYQAAALTLQLSSAVAQADGVFHDREVAHLRAQIEGWANLTIAERRRLHAHLQWLTTSPMNLAALKKKLEPVPAAARETLAAFMAELAHADGFVSPEEVKFLEKVYKALGIDPKRVFSDIHATFRRHACAHCPGREAGLPPGCRAYRGVARRHGASLGAAVEDLRRGSGQYAHACGTRSRTGARTRSRFAAGLGRRAFRSAAPPAVAARVDACRVGGRCRRLGPDARWGAGTDQRGGIRGIGRATLRGCGPHFSEHPST